MGKVEKLNKWKGGKVQGEEVEEVEKVGEVEKVKEVEEVEEGEEVQNVRAETRREVRRNCEVTARTG